jgi:hypothetical protein
MLGGEELSDVNTLAHLGVIEQRSNELLQVRKSGGDRAAGTATLCKDGRALFSAVANCSLGPWSTWQRGHGRIEWTAILIRVLFAQP